MARGPDGNVWFVETFGQGNDSTAKIARITPSGHITELPMPGSGANLAAMTAGPDGNLWLAGDTATGSFVRRVTVDGTVTDFPLPVKALITDITAGRDGNLWFTEYLRDKIGRISPAGQLKEFAVQSANRSPTGIVAADDGTLWITEAALDQSAIVHMTPDSTTTEFLLPANPSHVENTNGAMTLGADGNIWFIEPNGFGIGRITPSGAPTEFALRSGNGCPRGLTTGSDANIWFTDTCGRTVGRIDTIGSVTQFGLPSALDEPVGIAPGGDGRVWFTENGGDRIASIGTKVPEFSLGLLIMNFGRPDGTATQSVAVTNIGEASLRITSTTIAGADADAFTIGANDCAGHSIHIGDTCHVEVKFTHPPGTGLRAARLLFQDNATGSPQTVSLLAQLPDCKLPVITKSESQSGEHFYHGGFLDLASGDISPDPAGGFSQIGYTQAYHSDTAPILSGPTQSETAGFWYDRALKRWLPVSGSVVSPDGARYAFVDSLPPYDIHVVDVASGADRDLSGVTGRLFSFAREGLYVLGDVSPAGNLYLVDPGTGAKRLVLQSNDTRAVADGAAWIGSLNKDDPAPPQPEMGGGAVYNQVSRHDLATGAETPWFYRPGTAVDVVAAAGGQLVLETYVADRADLWIVSGPSQAVRLTIGPDGDPLTGVGELTADAFGLWFAAGFSGQVYFWSSRTGLVLVSSVKAGIAGTCG